MSYNRVREAETAAAAAKAANESHQYLECMAIRMLLQAHLSLDDTKLLAADLETVHYEPRIDKCGDVGIERIFLGRIGGVPALGRYLECIRPRRAR